MKKLLGALLFLGLCIIQGCKSSSPEPTAAQKATALMVAKPWVMNSLTIDGVADNTFFVGLKLTFTSKGFTAENGAPVWPTSGTWNFTDTNATSFKRDDGLVVSIDILSNTSMQLKLTWLSTTTGGRNDSVAGEHVFLFSH